MTDREKLVGLIVEIENEIIKAYPYTTEQFRIEKTADYLLANGVTVLQWRDAKTNPPTKDGEYLTFISCEEGEWIETDEFDTTSKIWRSVDAYHEDATEFVTHWMPLLEPPKKEENIGKAEDCRYYTQNSFWGAGCLGTKEIDPCKGDGCERWKSKEAP